MVWPLGRLRPQPLLTPCHARHTGPVLSPDHFQPLPQGLCMHCPAGYLLWPSLWCLFSLGSRLPSRQPPLPTQNRGPRCLVIRSRQPSEAGRCRVTVEGWFLRFCGSPVRTSFSLMVGSLAHGALLNAGEGVACGTYVDPTLQSTPQLSLSPATYSIQGPSDHLQGTLSKTKFLMPATASASP